METPYRIIRRIQAWTGATELKVFEVDGNHMVSLIDMFRYAQAVRIGTAVEAALIAEDAESPRVAADKIRRLYTKPGNLVEDLNTAILELSERSDGEDHGASE